MEDLELLNVFHAFWDAFPSPVRLIRRDRMVLAVNKAAASLGQRAGVCCAAEPPAARHVGCLAQNALSSGQSQTYCPVGLKIRCWIPISVLDDGYIHFSILPQ